MANFVGADIAELRALAKRFEAGGKTLRDAGTKLGSQVRNRSWTGPDADEFRNQWDHNHRRLLDGVAQQLILTAKELVKEADEQERASAPTDGGIGLGGGLGGATAHGQLPPDYGEMSPTAFQNWLEGNLDIDGLQAHDATEGAIDEHFVDKDLRHAIEHASDDELRLLRDLMDAGLTKDQLAEVLKGGQVWIDDPSLYDKWRGYGADRRLLSSHYRGEMKDDQYAINGPLVGHALFGRARGGTFIQLERYPETQIAAHKGTYDIYKDTGLNVGPWGGSKASEAKPIQLGENPRPKDPQYVNDGFIGADDLRRDHSPDRVVDSVIDHVGIVNPIVGGIDAIRGD